MKRALEDPSRLAALERSGLMDSEPEERFDRLTRELAGDLDAPAALVSLVDSDRQFFKSAFRRPRRGSGERAGAAVALVLQARRGW